MSADTCMHGLTRAFCAVCKRTTGRVAVLRPDASAPDAYEGRRVDPYRVRRAPRAVTREVHSLVPVDAPDGVRGIIARVKLDLTLARTVTRKNGSTYERPITKGRAYRVADVAESITVHCPMCAKRGTETRLTLEECILVTPYILPLPRIESCVMCAGGDEHTRAFCKACDGRGWVVLGQDLVQVDLACAACVAELRGGNGAVYTAPNHSGEPGNPRKGSSMGAGSSAAMCRGCQQTAANKRTGLCSRCEKAPLQAIARDIRRINHRLSELTQAAPGKDA